MFCSNGSQVTTAVDFIGEVFGKGHKEADLRKYLIHRRHLTKTQVDQAFELYKGRVDTSGGTSERLEVTKSKATANTQHSKRKRLINEFLKTENNYINVLECLVYEYYKYLSDMAHRKKIKISQKELESIFEPVSRLCKFHMKFYEDIVRRKSNFGEMFVRHFTYFRSYGEYMKNCSLATKKIRDYVHDKNLRKCLNRVRSTSRRPNDDMMDLVLTPLDRISDYKNFLDSLHEYTDKSQKSDYVFLGKASRRIGRIVDHIELYKHTIVNRNEMNKVQQFLDRQCNIIKANRRIVRWGLMTRRTTTWPTRNKRYIFFLFNDVLLWTTRTGELQNLVFLRDCVVRESDSKSNASRKFEVVANGKHHKLLKLECKEVRQRNLWYNVMMKEVALAKKVKKEESSNPEEENRADYINRMTESLHNSAEPKKGGSWDAMHEEEGTNLTHRRYRFSRNFKAEDLNAVYQPLNDDVISETSGTEQDPFFDQDKYGDSMNVLFPNVDVRLKEFKETSNERRIQEQVKGPNEIFSRLDQPNGPRSIQRLSSPNSSESYITSERAKGSCSSSSPPKKMRIIRRPAKIGENLKIQSSYTIRL